MKKRISAILICTLLINLISSFSFNIEAYNYPYVSELFSDDFSGYKSGVELPASDYYYNGAPAPVPIVHNYGGDYGNVMQLSGGPGPGSWCGPPYSVVTRHHGISNPLKHITIKFDLLLSDTLPVSVYALDLIPSTEGGAGFMTLAYFSADGYLSFGTTQEHMEYVPNKWYSFEMILDYANYTHSIYVDGVKKVLQEPLPSDGHTAFRHWRISLGGGLSSDTRVYVDNVRYNVPYRGTPPALKLSVTDGNMCRARCVVGKEYCENPVMVFAVYKHNQLTSAEIRKGLNHEEITLFDILYPISPGDELQVFMFEDMQSMRPLCSSGEAYIYSDADFALLKEQWRDYLTGTGEDYNSNINAKNRVIDIRNTGAYVQSNMSRDPKAVALWRGRMNVTADMTLQYQRIYQMALAWGTPGSDLYKNAVLKADILYALRWGYDNLYGQNEIDGKGWRSIWLYNWWDWYVGVPHYLVDTLLIMEEELSKEEIETYLSLYRYLLKNMRVANIRENVSSRSYNAMAVAALCSDARLASELLVSYNILFSYVTSDSGMYEDYSYLTHNNVPYTGSYGTGALLDRIVSVISVTEGTPFKIAESNKRRIEEWIINAFQPLMYQGGMMSMVNGRSVATSQEPERSFVVIRSALDIIDFADDAESLKVLIRRHLNEYTEPYLHGNLSVAQIVRLDRLISQMSSGNVPTYIRNQVFYNMDRVVHHRPSYAAGVSMSSSRIPNYESINGQNKTGWYHSDGMLYLYVPEDPWQYDTAYFTYADPYKMPGTTVDTQERQAVSIAGGKEYFSSQNFVGGASLRNEFGVAAMSLESFNNNEQDSTPPTEAGGPQPLHESSLTAKKSWFLFDDEVVALGSNICANDNVSVRTIVENRKVTESDMDGFSINGNPVPDETNQIPFVNQADLAYVPNLGGYYFPFGGKLYYQKKSVGDYHFLEMWLDHGVNPENMSYSYVALPGMTQEQVQSYSQELDIVILSNTDCLQAVKETSLGITGMVFWESGACEDVTVSHPLIVLIQEQDGIYELVVSDPTHKLSEARISIAQSLRSIEVDGNIDVSAEGDTTVLQVDLSNSRGESFSARFDR